MAQHTKYEVNSNGVDYLFYAVHNLTEPCPVCGIPACGSEDILWYERDGKNIALVFDGGLFSVIIEEYLGVIIRDDLDEDHCKIAYEKLPLFLREWNECTGWESSWDYDGYEICIEDFTSSLKLIQSEELSEWLRNGASEYITRMLEHADQAKRANSQLKIVRG